MYCIPASSFDHAGRYTPTITTDLTRSLSGNQMDMQKGIEGRPPQAPFPKVALSNSLQGHVDKMDVANSQEMKPTEPKPIAYRSPKTLRDALAHGKTSNSPSLDNSQPSPINTSNARDQNRFSVEGLGSPDSSPFLEQEDSLHSTSERNYERNYMGGFCDVAQPKFSSKQSFQDVSYLSSMSSNTFSNQSMISSANDQQKFAFRIATDAGNPLGELSSLKSPGPSMRSGHSLARSIISVSPRGDTPKHNPGFDYLRRSPSKQGDAPGMISNQAVEDLNNEKQTDTTSLDEVAVNPAPVMNEIKESILPVDSSNSGRSSSPPGFVLHD
jgi:hypothetical protein